MSIATTAPQRSQGMILLSITSLASGGRGGGSTGPASSGVVPKAASICRVNSSPKGLKIAVCCVVIGSDGSPTTSQAVNSKSSAVQGETATRAEFVKCGLVKSVNHAHEDCADRRREGHDRGRQTQPSDPAAGRQRLLHPCNTFFKRFADRPCVHAGRFLEQ